MDYDHKMKKIFSQRHNHPQKQLSDDFKSKVESWLGDQINRAQQSAAMGAKYDTKEKIIDEYENQNIVNLTYSQKEYIEAELDKECMAFPRLQR